MDGWEFFAFFFAIVGLCFFVGFPVWVLVMLYGLRHDLEEWRRRQDQALPPAAKPAPPAAPRPAPAPPLPPPAPAPVPAPAAAPASPPPLPPLPARESAPAPAPASSPRPPAPAPIPPSPPAPRPVRHPEVESAAAILLKKAWNWIVVGEEFRQKGVPMEYAVATQWLLRIGLLIVIFGSFASHQLAIEKGHVREALALSIVAGSLVIGGGLHLFGRKYQLLGQGLVGGGIAILYANLYAAGARHGVILLAVAFGGMAFVTLVTAVIAVRFRSLLVALLGLLGGYLTPVLLRTGTGSLPVLYAYLLVLGFGMLGVAWKRQWPLVTWLAFACHTLLVGASIHSRFTPGQFPLVMGYLGVFFLLFSTAVFLYNVATRTVASLLELAGLLLAATFFFGFGYWIILKTWPGQHEHAAWLALALCVYYILHAAVLQRRGVHDRGLQTVFLGLGAIFLSITLPLLFSKGWLTVTWAMEALVLLWMSRTLSSPILRLLSGLLYAVLLGRVLFHDLHDRFFGLPEPGDFRAYLGVLVPRLVQFLMPVLSLAGAWKLLQSERAAPPSAPTAGGRPSGVPAATALVLVYGLLFLYLNFEMHRFFSTLYAPLVHPGLTLVWIGLGAALLFHRRALGPAAAAILLSLLAAALLAKLALFDLPAWRLDASPLRYAVPYETPIVLVRLLHFGLLFGFAAFVFRLLRPEAELKTLSLGAGWTALALLLGYLTLETGSALHTFLPAFEKAGLSLLWSLFACVLVGAGLRNGSRALRLAGLALFAVVVFKIHSDLARAEALYRVIALVAVGVILIVASFFYLKYKDRFEPRPPPEAP